MKIPFIKNKEKEPEIYDQPVDFFEYAREKYGFCRYPASVSTKIKLEDEVEKE